MFLCIKFFMRIESKKPVNNAAKAIVNTLWITAIRLPFTNNLLAMRRAKKLEWQRKYEHNIKSLIEEWKLFITLAGNMEWNWVCFLLDKIDWHMGMSCWNQKLTVKYCLENCSKWRNGRRKYNIYGNVKMMLEENCEARKLMKFLKKRGIFKEI